MASEVGGEAAGQVAEQRDGFTASPTVRVASGPFLATEATYIRAPPPIG